MEKLKYGFLNGWAFVLMILIGISSVGFAQVNQDELEQNLPPVVFINYEGPNAYVNTREEIRQVGVVLGRSIATAEGASQAEMERLSYEEKIKYTYKIERGAKGGYFIIHCVGGVEEGKIDSDIFGLGVDIGVDHVRNLRTMIQGYLQEAYSYNARDALLLAEYITIYNAVYRGNWDYFGNRYKSQVIDNLTKEKAGLSIRYDEWPGRTLILIPLGSGGLSAIDTSTISDRRVIEELRKEDDMGIPQRQDMVNLKEREADQAEQRAGTEREAARQNERDAAQERQNVAQERENTQSELSAGIITDDEARRRQEELDKRDQAAADKEQEANRQREEAQRLDNAAEQKTAEAQKEREEIAKDQQSTIASDGSDNVIGIVILRETPTIMGRLVRLETATFKEQKRSPLETVHIRTVTLLNGKIIAIAGENIGNGAVRLVEINSSSLEIARQGDDDIKTGSLIWINGADIYAITIDLKTNDCYLGRFDSNLAIKAKSAVKVHQNASLTIQQGRLLTQADNGSVLMLDPASLANLSK